MHYFLCLLLASVKECFRIFSSLDAECRCHFSQRKLTVSLLAFSLAYTHIRDQILSRLLQVLHADFRLDYCRLWQALIRGDMSGVERYSRRLGAGDLYPLFACVLTARSWTSVNAGISSVPVTQSEVWAHAQFMYRSRSTTFHSWESVYSCFSFSIVLVF